jgi:hypothetical protein
MLLLGLASALLGVLALVVVVVVAVITAPLEIAGRLNPFRGGSGRIIPAGAGPFLSVYDDAARVFGQSAFVLAALHETESSFSLGRDASIRTGANGAGAAGPMQFVIAGDATPAQGGSGGTWGTYRDAVRKARVARPSTYPASVSPHPNVYDSVDAIYAAAAYLKAHGATSDLGDHTLAAVIAYKGETAFMHPFATAAMQVALTIRIDAEGGDGASAATFGAGSALSSVSACAAGAVPIVDGPKAVLGADGLAAAPAGAPDAVKAMIAAANCISDKPYDLGGGHGATLMNSPSYDCSSSTSYVLHAGRVFGDTAWCSSQLATYGRAGVDPAGWVTVYAHGPCDGQGHAFIVVAGLRFDTDYGYDTGPNRGQHGPRWRGGPRPTAGFAARHPEGL